MDPADDSQTPSENPTLSTTELEGLLRDFTGVTGVRAGDQIGPYRVLGLLGEGGFGEVWLAERREPFVQRVALKVIKPGMDSKAVIARFEQERQALAVMDHPNVAKVFDGGLTPPSMGSRPYFVMEHVPGESITSFCDRHRTPLLERLELLIPVCEAIEHAHTRGLIHRDIKPSNILVSIKDGKAVPKVIDFGVAKALNQTLTERTIFTETGQLVGTPEYMSPEQAEMGAVDIDGRTDVYSLGVVLYELLTGVLPFESAMLRQRGLGEIHRIIREVDPPTPSKRLSSIVNSQLSDIARQRGTDAVELVRAVRGSLESLPLRAMAKDRRQRFGSPAEMAAELRRYLAGGRVARWRPRSRARYRWAFAAGTLLLMASVGLYLNSRGHGKADPDSRDSGSRAGASLEPSEQRSTIDPLIQRIVFEELSAGVTAADAAGGRAVVMNPANGDVLAMVDVVREIDGVAEYDWVTPPSELSPNARFRVITTPPTTDGTLPDERGRCQGMAFMPGTAFMPFVWAIALDAEVVRTNEIIYLEDGTFITSYGRALTDVVQRDRATYSEVLALASKIGMAKISERLRYVQLRDKLLSFGFGRKTGVSSVTETSGLLTSMRAWSVYTQTSVALGEEVAVTPIQLAAAFSAFAREGALAGTVPAARMVTVGRGEASTVDGVRVVSPPTALEARAAMRTAVDALDNRTKVDLIDGQRFRYTSFGQSGLARARVENPPPERPLPRGTDGVFPNQYTSSYMLAGPADAPRLVIVVVIDDPGPEIVRSRRHYGATTAGPVALRAMDRSLMLLRVPPQNVDAPAPTKPSFDPAPIGHVTRLTVHHSATSLTDLSEAACRDHVEQIRSSHRARGFADIGYHFVIDPAGRVWPGRSSSLQGDHVAGQNAGNIGIMLIGDFSKDEPTPEALAALTTLLSEQRKLHGLEVDAVVTHGELAQAQCPGARLQSFINSYRQR